MQEYVTGGLRLHPDGEFLAKLKASQYHFQNYQRWSLNPVTDLFVVEVGTGWFPIIPIGLYLCGARQVLTYDIVRLLKPETFRKVVGCFCLFAQTGKLEQVLPGARPDRIATFVDLARSSSNLPPIEFLKCLNIRAVLGNVCNLPLDQASVDLVFSHGVLEHFAPPLLEQAMSEFRRVCGRSSVMSHFIGMADQFGLYDKSITPFNNLRYTSRAWRWLDSPIIPQNRLRASDYVRACIGAGFEIVDRRDVNGAESDLASIEVAKEFAKYSRDDLLVLYLWLVARPV